MHVYAACLKLLLRAILLLVNCCMPRAIAGLVTGCHTIKAPSQAGSAAGLAGSQLPRTASHGARSAAKLCVAGN